MIHYVLEEAARQNATVRHIGDSSLIRSLENIASVIKFKKDDFAKVEEISETEI